MKQANEKRQCVYVSDETAISKYRIMPKTLKSKKQRWQSNRKIRVIYQLFLIICVNLIYTFRLREKKSSAIKSK